MRIVMLLPLALAAVAAGGCRTASEGTEQAALGVPQRDLTLQQTAAPEVEIASPVELARAPQRAADDAAPAARASAGSGTASRGHACRKSLPRRSHRHPHRLSPRRRPSPPALPRRPTPTRSRRGNRSPSFRPAADRRRPRIGPTSARRAASAAVEVGGGGHGGSLQAARHGDAGTGSAGGAFARRSDLSSTPRPCRSAAIIAPNPSSAVRYRGVQPLALRSFRLETRSDRAIVFPTTPPSGVAQRGSSRGGRTPSSRAIPFASSRRRIGSSSTTL